MSDGRGFEFPIPSETSFVSGGWQSTFVSQGSDGQQVGDLGFHSTLQAIRQLKTLEADWDGCGSAKPKPESIDSAERVARIFHTLASSATSQPWSAPHVSANEEGHVVFEWWVGEKKLTIYVRNNKITFIKVWGSNIDDDMEDGCVTDAGFPKLWQWLNG